MSANLYYGKVMHQRLKPARNRFVYRVFFLRFDLSRTESLKSPLFSINKWNVFSFHERDHGARDGTRLEPWIRALLGREGISADGNIYLQCFPRVLGYVFNPVAFWLCYDRTENLRAVLAEVSNTFGERHNYLLAHADGRPIRNEDWLETRKMFHVSPFFPVQGGYRFRFTLAHNCCNMRIDYSDAAGPLLLTSIGGRATAFDSAHLLRAFVFYPWMTLGVIARIHYQALKLWLKRVPFFSKPVPPSKEITR